MFYFSFPKKKKKIIPWLWCLKKHRTNENSGTASTLSAQTMFSTNRFPLRDPGCHRGTVGPKAKMSWDILCLKAKYYQGLVGGSYQNDTGVNVERPPNPQSQWGHLNTKKYIKYIKISEIKVILGNHHTPLGEPTYSGN